MKIMPINNNYNNNTSFGSMRISNKLLKKLSSEEKSLVLDIKKEAENCKVCADIYAYN